MSDVVLHWFRRDLRLADNPALQAAAQGGARVVPVYVLSDWQNAHDWTGSIRQQFLCGCLESLAKNLEVLGNRLILRRGRADVELEKLIIETGARAVHFNRDYDPYGRAMEAKLRAVCARLGVACRGFKDRVLHEPEEVLTGSGDPYRVFTPYAKAWMARDKGLPHGRLVDLGPASTVGSLPLPGLVDWQLPGCTAEIPEPGEQAARARLKHFIEGGVLHRYKQERDIPAGMTTSHLGQDLRFGLLSIREIHQRCIDSLAPDAPASARVSVETYIKELAWREFYQAILWHYPNVFEEEFNPEFRGMPWPGTDEHFEAWSQGRTGFPIVDAGMRQLLATGFMHNRLRMITAMFLTKDLHAHWKRGESFFMQHLIDGENASNNGGWQWSAGTGADAAPYFRIQNPWTQTQRHDPLGVYIKTWVPELRDVAPERFHEAPAAGRLIAPGYPRPIVDHASERAHCLARFGQMKRGRAALGSGRLR